ncbi:hypothetical protein PHYBOEH_011968 [Phytophthora boehmeriae]|uniref:Uncharacterized protein n=1 Tax=Phytophthora boehmeriae TaxID=109152 RepID=A0A8T1WXJ1_9STRA|nr:hypothetical protein PHYBOEH_011968 [Phytophthora boehmeriae]
METTQAVAEDGVAISAASESVTLTTTLTPRRRSLLPILPQQSVPLGSLVVDREETRVVYLAPLMSASKEIYFAKHKELLKAAPVTNTQGQEEEEREVLTKKKMLASLERHLARAQTPAQQLVSPNQQSSSNLFDVPASVEFNRNSAGSTTPEVVQVPASPADTELKKMKQRVKLLPITDQDHTDFWKTIRGYERMRAYYHRSVLTNGAATPMGFNMEAAFNKMVGTHWIALCDRERCINVFSRSCSKSDTWNG